MTVGESELQDDFDSFDPTIGQAHTDLILRNNVIDIEKNTIREFIRDAYHGGQVVDVGGSWGEVLSGVPPQSLDDATIIDFAVNRLRGGYGTLPDVNYVGGDAFNLPIADEAASLVVCSEVIEHVEDPKALINELSRILQPGGTLVLSGLSDNKLKNTAVAMQIRLSDGPQYLFETDEPEKHDNLGMIYHLGFSRDELSTMFSNSGLQPRYISYVLFRGLGSRLDHSTAVQLDNILSKPILRQAFSGHFVTSATKRFDR